MSYEGFVRVLCARGHMRTYDYLAFDAYSIETPPVCSNCQSPFVWAFHVDQTNGYEPLLDVPDSALIIKEADQLETCNLGHIHCIRERTYEIPKDYGRKL